MVAYIVRRLLLAAIVFVAVSFLAFVLLAAPLDPLAKKYGPYYGPKRTADRHKYDLDDSRVKRYFLWVKGTITGNPSYVRRSVCSGRLDACHNTRIWPQVWKATRRTALLGALALVVIVLFSLLIGTIAAVRPGSVLDVVDTGVRARRPLAAALHEAPARVQLQTVRDSRPAVPGRGGNGLQLHTCL